MAVCGAGAGRLCTKLTAMTRTAGPAHGNLAKQIYGAAGATFRGHFDTASRDTTVTEPHYTVQRTSQVLAILKVLASPRERAAQCRVMQITVSQLPVCGSRAYSRLEDSRGVLAALGP